MKISRLQRYILLNCYLAKRDRLLKKKLFSFYGKAVKKPKAKDINDIITRSINLLIKKDLTVGFGSKTSQKWYIREIKLTPAGRKLAKKFLGEQRKLPFKK
jgi:hypothetical protein